MSPVPMLSKAWKGQPVSSYSLFRKIPHNSACVSSTTHSIVHYVIGLTTLQNVEITIMPNMARTRMFARRLSLPHELAVFIWKGFRVTNDWEVINIDKDDGDESVKFSTNGAMSEMIKLTKIITGSKLKKL